MKKIQLNISAVILLAATSLFALPAGYKEVNIEELRAKPEEYSNKNIVIDTYYHNFIASFPAWMVYCGFTSDKYFYLNAAPASVPFLLRKKSDAGKFLTDIENKTKVKIYGRIKKFKKISAKYRRRFSARLPQFYLEVDKIEQKETPQEKKEEAKPEAKKKDNLRTKQNSLLPEPKL